MSIEVSSVELIEDLTDPADPRSPKKRRSLIRAMILQQTAPEHRHMDADADAALTRKSMAEQSYEDWAKVGDGGTAQGRELKNVRLKEAQVEKDSAIVALMEERGDYKGNNPAPPELQAAGVSTEQDIGAGVKCSSKRTAKRRTWRDVAMPYVVETFKAGSFTTAKMLFKALERKAGADSPFDLGTGANRDSLVVRDISESLTLKTIQNAWGEIKGIR